MWKATSARTRDGASRRSVRIARRSVELDPPAVSPWPPIRIETLRDNLASKMSALVGRGLPRDFVDIESVVDERLASVEECWDLWLRRNPGSDIFEGKASVLRHLEAIELRRPSPSLPPAQRGAAERRRDWVRRELIKRPAMDGLGL